MAIVTKAMAAPSIPALQARCDGPSAALTRALHSRRRSKVACMASASPSPPGGNRNSKKKTIRELMAFAGPAPETINGRLAMVGFVSALGVEFWSGRDIFAQINSGNGVEWFVGTAALLTVASLVPLLKGVMPSEQSSSSFMSAKAEIWNGRLAMVGLLALAFTEYVKGGPLV